MNNNSGFNWGATCLAAGLVAGAAAVGQLSARAAAAEPEPLLERAQSLERKSQELKADGQQEKAMQLMREVEEIRAPAGKVEKGYVPKAAAPDQRRQELKRRLGDALAELKESSVAGKQDEAAQVKRRVQQLEAELDSNRVMADAARTVKRRVQQLEGELARFDQSPAGERMPGREGKKGRVPFEGQRPPPPEMAAMEQRLHHLLTAMDNLHAAGMHEPAERLTQEAERLQRQLKASSPGFRGPGQPGGEIERLRAEVQELRQSMRELRARVEELSGARR
jgi:hemerythrin-like domain-containing protein